MIDEEVLSEPILFSIKTCDEVLEKFDAIGFNIPIYQRLYTWTQKEINELLTDFYNASKNSAHYFIGNLTLHYNKSSKNYDVIDGQQRLTTLWLMVLVLCYNNKEMPCPSFLHHNNESRLKFIAREDDNNFLSDMIGNLIKCHGNLPKMELLIDSTKSVNPFMVEAILCINFFFKKKEVLEDLKRFTKFLLEHVKSAAVFLPETIDLNKYFEDMNNRGLQLESHHVLKAYFIEKLPNELQSDYADIWDAVSQMNQYIEYGFKKTLKDARADLVDNFNKILLPNYWTQRNELKEKKLCTIVDDAIGVNYQPDLINETTQVEKVISIINFPEFLLHCLKIYKGEKNLKKISLDDKKLIQTFNFENIYDKAQSFIIFLLKARIAFDKYFIKSRNSNEGSRWEIRDLVFKNDECQYERVKHLEGEIVQLQSLLNAAFSTSVWVSKTLKYTIEDGFTIDGFLNELEHINNINAPMFDIKNLHLGTGTSRYWFFKLDYLLWKKWAIEGEDIPNFPEIPDLLVKVKNFQFRENKSVEHVQPRNPEDNDWVIQTERLDISEIKDQFGNLALISKRSNTAYSNQSPVHKKDDFVKKCKHWNIESLKLLHIYSYKEWNISTMNNHEALMIKILNP